MNNKKARAVIRRGRQGDENALAFIQTESWRVAFDGILDAETLVRCTDIDRAANMYKRLLEENIGKGYILSVDNDPIVSHIGMRLVTRSLPAKQS